MSLERQMRRKAERKLAEWAKSLPEIPVTDLFTPGTVSHVCFSHDDHCKTLRTGNGSHCTCSPDITYHRASE
jgi:hypothetical protein